MMRLGEAPMSCAAVVKSSSRRERIFERTARAKPGQSRKPSITEIPAKTPIGLQVAGSKAEKVA